MPPFEVARVFVAAVTRGQAGEARATRGGMLRGGAAAAVDGWMRSVQRRRAQHEWAGGSGRRRRGGSHAIQIGWWSLPAVLPAGREARAVCGRAFTVAVCGLCASWSGGVRTAAQLQQRSGIVRVCRCVFWMVWTGMGWGGISGRGVCHGTYSVYVQVCARERRLSMCVCECDVCMSSVIRQHKSC